MKFQINPTPRKHWPHSKKKLWLSLTEKIDITVPILRVTALLDAVPCTFFLKIKFQG